MGNQPSRVLDKATRRQKKGTSMVVNGGGNGGAAAGSGSSTAKHGNGSGNGYPGGRRRSTISHRAPPPATLRVHQSRRRSSVTSVRSPTTPNFKRKPSSVKSPEDLMEMDRLQRQHYLLKSARGTNCVAMAHLTMPATIIEVGTSNGIWALEMASEYPQTKVHGMDPRSVSTLSSIPSNLEYIQTSLFQPWPIASNSVDLVFQRGVSTYATVEQWQHLLREAMRVVKPGGYIEWVEAEAGHPRPGPLQQAFDQFMQQEYQAKGMDFHLTRSFDELVADVAGDEYALTMVDHSTYDIPLGEWPDDAQGKQLGFINQGIQKATYRNRKSYYAGIWAMSSQDYDAAMQALLDEFEEYNSYSRFHCWLAKKQE